MRFGGGGGTYHRVGPPKPVLEASKSGICLVGASFSSKENNRAKTKGGGGGKRIIAGGVQNRFWEGVFLENPVTSLNKEFRPFFLSDNGSWSYPSVASLSDYSIWRS